MMQRSAEWDRDSGDAMAWKGTVVMQEVWNGTVAEQ